MYENARISSCNDLRNLHCHLLMQSRAHVEDIKAVPTPISHEPPSVLKPDSQEMLRRILTHRPLGSPYETRRVDLDALLHRGLACTLDQTVPVP